MPSGQIGSISIRSWAYFVATLLFLREILEFALGFSSSLWLLVGAFFSTLVLLIGAAALSNRGIGTYRIFFVFYFILIVASFLVLVIALFSLKQKHPHTSRHKHHYVEKVWETHAYIYSGFGLLLLKIVFGWLMLKAYYYDQFCEEDRRAAPYEDSARDWSDEFGYSMTEIASTPPQYTKQYSALNN
uniref:Uncharacterized protein n=1 Tax=Ditylenchus dipsaci TaxID=166011 RepID=A0A915CUC0_9BILA